MMESPFFRSYYQTPSPPSYRRGPARMRSYPTQPSPPQPKRRVISIPVHYVESDSEKKSCNSAVKIQKAFRGFRLRKTVKKILELKRQVEGVEKKLQERETMALIKKDGLERLKVNETLMALLLKLDSIRGFDYGVRELRKAVIKKAIMLQEMIDSATDEDDDGTMEEGNAEKIDDDCGCDNRENLENSGEVDENADNLSEVLDDSSKIWAENQVKISEETEREINSEEIAGERETLEKSERIAEDADNGMESSDDSSKMQVENSQKISEERGRATNSDEIADKTLEKAETDEEADTANTMQVESLSAATNSWECVGEETEEQKSNFLDAGKEDNHGGSDNCKGGRHLIKESMNDEWFVVGGGDCGEEKDKKDKLLEKMADDNQRLMSMVADLCQKNALQTRLICSLSQRVEQLEKAMSDRLRKKKKKNNASLI